MLVIVHGEHVLLEQRPSTGIWGGLLSLPQLEDARRGADASPDGNASIDATIMQTAESFGAVASREPLTRFSHTFSHFRLHVSPYRIVLRRRQESVGQTSHVWYALNEIALAPLPAPVKKLLLSLNGPPDLLSGLG